MAGTKVYKEYNADSWPQARDALLATISEGRRILFRGQANSKWRLVSSLGRIVAKLREQQTGAKARAHDFIRKVEEKLVTEFEEACLRIPGVPRLSFENENERVAYAQHYSLPTRFLDWTTSAYVAAFFAFDGLGTSVFGPKHKVGVWAFDCEQGELFSYYKHKKDSRSERPAPDTDDFANVMAAIRIDNQPRIEVIEIRGNPNRRLVYQQGIFTRAIDVEDDVKRYFQRYAKYAAGTILTKVVMPGSIQRDVLKDLSRMGITAGILMHDHDGAAATAFNNVVRFCSD